MASIACLVCLVSNLVATTKMPLEEAALLAATWQNMSNLLLLDIYGCYQIYNCQCYDFGHFLLCYLSQS